MEDQDDEDVKAKQVAPDCGKKKAQKTRKWDDCMCAQVCEMVKAYNESKRQKKRLDPSPSNAKPGSRARQAYEGSIGDFEDEFAAVVNANPGNPDHPDIKKMFYSPPEGKPPGTPPPPDCQHAKWKAAGAKAEPKRKGVGAMNPDHMHPAGLNGPLTSDNCIWADARVNRTVGGGMNVKPAPKKMKAHPSCNCP